MKIGIIGSGAVGQTLAKGFKQEGHTVTLGTRDTAKPEVVQFNKDTGIAIADFETTAKTAELIVLSTKGTVAADALRLAGIAHLDKKIIIDTTNPLAEKGPDHGVLHFFTTLDFSLMEQLQQLAPAARFVKAFNSVGNAAMYKPQFSEGKPSMFICGNDEEAKKTVTGLLTAFGWETEDMGTMEAARAIEPLCILWCIPGFLHNSWSHAFKLLK